MTITNRLGRPMLAAMFVTGGADQLLHPDDKVDVASDVVDEIDDRTDSIAMPSETRDAVRINGAVQLVAGGLLASNRVPRLAATALAASLVPTTLAAHRFWEEADKRARAQQRIQFLKNLAMLGGLLITIGDTGREPSMGWRARRAAERASADLANTATEARRSARHIRRATSQTASDLVDAIGDSVGDAASAASAAVPTVDKGIFTAGRSRFSTPDISDVVDDARDLFHTARKAVSKQARGVSTKAGELGRTAATKLPDVSLAR